MKAFNAAEMESQRANISFLRLKKAANMLNRVWGTTSGIAQFMMMACLIATSNLQMCIPQFIMPAKGKFAMVALLTLVGDMPSSSPPSDAHPMSPTSPNALNTVVHSTTRKSRTLRKITPARCYGELAQSETTQCEVIKHLAPSGKTP